MKYISIVIILLALIAISYVNGRFIVEEDDLVVITQFGELTGKTYKVPGEYFKTPFIQKTHYFKKYNFQEIETHEIPTLDKKWLTIELKYMWKIEDPAVFYKNFNSNNLARKFINHEAGEAARKVVTCHKVNDNIFKVEKSYAHTLGYEIKEKAKENILKAGLNLFSLEAKIIKQSGNP